jgi:Homeodomain-like domain
VPAHKASPVQLSAEHERELSDLVRAHSTPQKLAERARIILLAATGLGIAETAQQLGIWRKTAGHWRPRWLNATHRAVVLRPRSRRRLSVRSWRWPARTPKSSMSRSVIGVKANWPGNRWPAASSQASRTALSGAF